MTKTYKLKIDSFKEKEREVIKKSTLILTIAMIGGLTISIINTGFNWKVLLAMIPLTIFAILFGLRKGLKMQKEAWDSFELKWDLTTLTKSQIRTKDISIKKNEIIEIKQNKYGVTIKSTNKTNSIFIPKELENFTELINELKSL